MDISSKALDDLHLETKSYSTLFGNGDTYAGLGGVVDPRILKAIYQSEDWIYILIDRIASKLAQIPWQVYSQTMSNGEEVLKPAFGHPVQRMLDTPNPLQSDYAFKYAAITDLSVTGNCLVYVSEMQKWLVQVPTEIINIDVAGNGDLRGYDIVGLDPQNFPVGMRYKLKPKDVIHIKRPNSSSVYWGLSPLIPGAHPAMFNKYTNEYLINFFKKGAQPGLVLELGEESNEQQAKKLLASIETAYTGRSAQRRAMVLPKGVKPHSLTHTLADMQLIEYLKNNRETLINIYGVPKHELSIAESGSLGSEEYKVALKNFWQGPLMSIGKMFESAFTQRLQQWLGQGHVIRLNYSNVPILQEDLKEKSDTATAMLSTMTYNEVRQRIWKLPPIEGGDVLRDLKQTTPQFPFGSAFSAQPEPLKTIEKTEEVEDKAMKLANYLKSDDNRWFKESRERIEEESKTAISKLEKLWLKLLEEQVVAAVKVAGKLVKEKSTEIPSKRKLQREIDAAMDGVEDEWRDGYTTALEAQIELGYDAALSIPFNEPYKDEIEAIRARDKAGRRKLLEARSIASFDQISNTTTEKIMRVIENGVKESQSLSEIRDGIMEVSKLSFSRASTIARTETLIANSIGEAAAMRNASEVIPDLVKVWINANDERVRGNPGGLYPDSEADHWRMMSETIPHNEKFSNGLAFPRDPSGEAGDVINCRCSMLVVSKEDLPKLGL